MWQSLFAVLALLLVTAVSINQRRTIAHAELEIMRNEIETVAAGKMTEALDSLSVPPFDNILAFKRGVSVEADGKRLSFELEGVIQNVEFDAAGRVRPLAGGTPVHKQVTLYIKGPMDAGIRDELKLPTDAQGRGIMTMSRVYSRMKP